MTLADYRRKRGEPLIPEEHEDAHAENHPGVWEYTQIGLILFIITAVEVGLYYIDLNFNLMVTILIVLSAAKFAFVVLWFMHLRFDSRLFGTLFVTGLVTAFLAFTVVIAMLHGQLV